MLITYIYQRALIGTHRPVVEDNTHRGMRFSILNLVIITIIREWTQLKKILKKETGLSHMNVTVEFE